MNIEALNYAYDLDCGGYSWEECPEIGGCVVVWDDPDPDYFPYGHGHKGLSCPFLAFAPNTGHFPGFDFPETVTIGEWTYRKITEGMVYGTDHDCHCHGTLTLDGWEFTGNTMDDAYPECPRCEGTGYVDSVGGEYALYAVVDD